MSHHFVDAVTNDAIAEEHPSWKLAAGWGILCGRSLSEFSAVAGAVVLQIIMDICHLDSR